MLDNEKSEGEVVAEVGLSQADYHALTEKFVEDWDEVMSAAAAVGAEREEEREDRRKRK